MNKRIVKGMKYFLIYFVIVLIISNLLYSFKMKDIFISLILYIITPIFIYLFNKNSDKTQIKPKKFKCYYFLEVIISTFIFSITLILIFLKISNLYTLELYGKINSNYFLVFTISVLMAGIIEEYFLRDFIFKHIYIYKNKKFTIATLTIFFLLLHSNIYMGIYYAILSILFTIFRIKHNTVLSSILSHIVFNLTVFIISIRLDLVNKYIISSEKYIFYLLFMFFLSIGTIIYLYEAFKNRIEGDKCSILSEDYIKTIVYINDKEDEYIKKQDYNKGIRYLIFFILLYFFLNIPIIL